MPKLTDRTIRSLKPTNRAYKKYDELGLFLMVNATGSKIWHFRFRQFGKENEMSLGHYPEVSLATARNARDVYRKLLSEGKDPAFEKRKAKLRGKSHRLEHFSVISEEFIDKERRSGKAPATIKKLEYFRRKLTPSIGRMPIRELTAPDLLAALRPLERAGIHETLFSHFGKAEPSSRVKRTSCAKMRCIIPRLNSCWAAVACSSNLKRRSTASKRSATRSCSFRSGNITGTWQKSSKYRRSRSFVSPWEYAQRS